MLNDRIEELRRQAQQAKSDGKWRAAIGFRQQIEALHDQLGADPVDKAKNLNMLAYLSTCCLEAREAVRAAEKSLSIYTQAPNQHPETLATYHALMAAVLAEAGRIADAVPYQERAVALFTQIFGEDDDFVQWNVMNLECMRRGEYREYLEREFRHDPKLQKGPGSAADT